MKKRDLAVVIAFLAAISLCGAAFLLLPKADFSPRERRVLASLPELGQDDFDSAFESYVVDHIPLREPLVALNAYFGLITGRDGLNGAYLGRDGYLLAAPMEKNDAGFARNLEAMASFVQSSGLPARLIAPMSKGAALADKIIGPHEPYPDEEYLSQLPEALPNVEIVDIGQVEYYKTDHHWTSRGAYQAYCAYMRAVGGQPSPEDAYEKVAREGFYGTTYAQSGYFASSSDTMEMWVSDWNASAFHWEKLDGYDMYQVFLGGDVGVDVLDSPSAPEGTLLLFKDSIPLPTRSRRF